MEPTTTTHGGVGGGEDSPPFWPPSTTISRRRNSPSPFLNPAFLIVFLPILFFILIFFLVPPFLNLTSQIVKPSTHTMRKGGGGGGSVKKSWDLFNVLLVLFAVLCGIFAKKTANDDTSTTTDSNSTSISSDDVTNMNMKADRVLSPNQWFEGDADDDINRNHHRFFSDRVSERSDVVHQLRRMNGGSVYSDLRHDAVQPMMNGDGSGNGSDERFKFFDDFDINRYRRLEANNVGDGEVVGPVHCRRRSMGELSDLKPMPVDKFVVTSSTESPPPPSLPSYFADEGAPVEETVPPSPAQPSPVRKPRKTTYRSVSSRRADVQKRARSPPPATSSPPPAPTSPPPEVIVPPLVEESVKVEKKKKSSNASKEIKTVLASIYNPVKRKKKYKTKIIIDDSVRSEPDLPVDSSSPSIQPPPPPPPPPLPPSVFSLFKKSSKSKKIHSVPPPPVPPPPPRFSLNRQNTALPPPSQPQPQPRASISQRRTHSTTKGRPPLPNKNNNVDNETLNSNSGGQSPFIPMPPPPPLPPFQVSAMKFTVKGDYVRVKSGPSTRCSSPELDSSSKEDSSSASNVMDGVDVTAQPSSVFCPSPDVNMKADTFIARLRDEWKNDKINSLKGKQRLGQVSGSKSFN